MQGSQGLGEIVDENSQPKALVPYRNDSEGRLAVVQSRTRTIMNSDTKESKEEALQYVGKESLTPDVVSALESRGYRKHELPNPKYLEAKANLYVKENERTIDVLVESTHENQKDKDEDLAYLTHMQVDKKDLQRLEKDLAIQGYARDRNNDAEMFKFNFDLVFLSSIGAIASFAGASPFHSILMFLGGLGVGFVSAVCTGRGPVQYLTSLPSRFRLKKLKKALRL